MRGLKRNPWLFGLGVLLAILVVSGGHVRADVNSDQSGSIVIFPKVIADGTRDTIIQITNTSNMPAQAHCFYVNNPSGTCSTTTTTSCRVDTDCPGVEVCNIPHPNFSGFCSVTSTRSCSADSDCNAPTCANCFPAGETCQAPCNEIDFDLFLTAQQPTMWRVSTGRLVSFTSACKMGQPCACGGGGTRCPGFDPGTGALNSFAVKPAPNFLGELKCIQTTDDFQTPLAQNSLKGEAIIETIRSGQISEYNALSIQGLVGLNTDDDLKLDNVEYNRCPNSLLLNHYADGATDVFSGTTVTINTELTLVACTELLEPQLPVPGRVHFSITDEFESSLSADVNFDCTLNARLALISSQLTHAGGLLDSQFAKTRITPPSDLICLTGDRRGIPCTLDTDCPNRITTTGGTVLGCRPRSGVLGVAEEFHTAGARPAGTAAVNLHMENQRPGLGDIMVVPGGTGTGP